MFSEIKKSPLSFILLFVGLLVSLILYFYFSYDTSLQRRIIYFTGGYYFLWSLFHHYQKGDLQTSVILEYLLIALFAVLLLTGTLL
jgi:hypothetical protein